MRRFGPGIILALLLATPSTVSAYAWIVEQWSSSESPDWKPSKIIVVALIEDPETRHRFEDKLVSQLRGRNITAVTSYPLVPNLLAPGSREEVLLKVAEQEIDGAFTIRLVPLEEKGEAAWSEEWKHQVETDVTIRALIESSLPLPKTKTKLYGVEVTLWGRLPAIRYWTGRSGAHKLKDLREGATDFIQDVIAILKDKRRI